MAEIGFTQSNPEAAQNCGVINPYALAEVVAGRRIAWQQVDDRRQLLEELLQTPYDELFDPKYGGPLYLGLTLDEQMRLVRTRPALLDVAVTLEANDFATALPVDLSSIRRLSDLAVPFDTQDIGRIEVKQAERVGPTQLRLTLRLPEHERLQRLARVLPRALIETVAYDPTVEVDRKDWTRRPALGRTGGDSSTRAPSSSTRSRAAWPTATTLRPCRRSPGRCPIGSAT